MEVSSLKQSTQVREKEAVSLRERLQEAERQAASHAEQHDVTKEVG
jgi:uncharacterized protein involved in exopolysaccharide biosynthesis